MTLPAALRVASVGLALVFAPAQALASDAEKEAGGGTPLAHLRAAIDASRDRVAAYELRERGLLDALEALDRSAGLLADEVARARHAAAEAAARREAIAAEMAAVSARLDETRDAMRRRAVALYKAGELGPVRTLFAAGGVRDFFTRVNGLQRLVETDAELLARFRSLSASLEQGRVEAERAEMRHADALSALRTRSAELAAERDKRRQLIQRVHANRRSERGALAELETAARALEETLAVAPGDGRTPPRAGGAGLAALQGRLPAPVDAPIAARFGRVVDPAFRTERFRKGVEFEAPRGAPVRAVAPGAVRFAGWLRGFGQIVVIDHGRDWFSVHGHLDRVNLRVGQHVQAGGAIGTVGETGSLDGPRLYFEIRRGREAVDPEDWLRPRSRVAAGRH